MTSRRVVLLGLVLATAVVACDRVETVLSTPTSLVVGGTSTTAAPGTTTVADDTSTTLRGQSVSEFETVARLSTANGEVLHIVIPAGGYTDVDLENFIRELKDADPELWGVEVFDDPTAPEAFSVEEASRTQEQSDLLDRHHLVSLVNGDTLRFQGPFKSFGESILGS
ncbi:MAG: hypothetical protein WD269_05305 [Acidimicrobiia bacterium]